MQCGCVYSLESLVKPDEDYKDCMIIIIPRTWLLNKSLVLLYGRRETIII